ncbi:hypothetical protein BBD42_18290 [Paenibacillus sp. BIHB 4019]|uniref:Carbohydrate binding X2 domain-containing protein n=1 Tax=Paenibacillus sp. BIHB 4019 TaxID=1870819 RepID=A0A1B2DKE9_9BACL|nr:X2-like carbohydrate binding domain-containing protein [Paenibacillus sp. BIHB 4019]ANY68207.1 hypothetical protein BBD42_18290 [Paenibacillus sp. BIHB 4019]
MNQVLSKKKLFLLFLLALSLFLVSAIPASKVHAAATSESYQWKSVQINGGGYVPAVVYSTAQNGLLYARTDVGGAYRWNSSAKTWIPLNDNIGRSDVNDSGILSVAADPTNPNKVYLMTGLYYESWGSYGAFLASSDKGATWTRTPLPFKVGGNQLGRGTGERLQVDPNLPNVLFMGSNKDGLWKSVDSGATWNKVTSFPASGTTFVLFDPSSSSTGAATQRIIVGATNATAGSLYISNDGGNTWNSISGQPTSYVPMRIVMNGRNLYITYAGFGNPNSLGGPYDATSGAVYKYNLTSKAWSNITPLGTGITHGFSGISIDKQNPNNMLISTLCRYTPADEIYRTTDGGSTWKGILTTGIRSETKSPYPSLITGMTPHWITSVEIDPFDSNKAMFVTGYGTYLTENLKDSDNNQSVTWSFETVGMEETVPVELKSPTVGPYLFSGLGDVTGFRHDNLDVSPVNGPYNPQFSSNESLDYAELQSNIIVRTSKYTANGFVNGLISTDRGVTWKNFESEPPGVTNGGKIAINADGTNLLWSPVGMGVYVSIDLGKTWTASPGFAGTDLKPITDRVNPNKAYLYDPATGKVYISHNGGISFAASSASVPVLQSWLLADGVMKAVYGQEGHLWLTGGTGGLYRSSNSGASFSKVANVTEAYRLGFGKSAPSQTYPSVFITGIIDGVYGFYRSDDQGATWVRINDDQHQYGSIQDITGDPKVYGRLYVGTNGRGILYGDKSGYVDTNATLSPMTATFDPTQPSDIIVNMTLKSNMLNAVMNGTTLLVQGTDYTLSGSCLTVRSSYLQSLPSGTATLTFDMNNGIDPVLDIVVKSTANAPDTTTYNFESDLQGLTASNVTITRDIFKSYFGNASAKVSYSSSQTSTTPDVKLETSGLQPGDLVTYRIFVDSGSDANSLEFYGVHDGNQRVTLGTDTTFLKNWWFTYTYLVPDDWNDVEAFGFRVLGNGGGGSVWVDSVNVVHGATIAPMTAAFDRHTPNQADIAVTMTLNGTTLLGIKNTGVGLVQGTDYTVTGNNVTILKSYLAKQLAGTTSLTFDFNSGNDPVLHVQVSNSSVVTDTARYNFETGLHGWRVDQAIGTQDMTKAYAGETSLKLVYPTITSSITPNFSAAEGDLKPGDEITYHIFVDNNADLSALQFAAMHDGYIYTDISGGYIASPAKGQWLTYTFVLPNDWLEVNSVGLYLRGGSGGGTIWLDSVSVKSNAAFSPVTATFDKNAANQSDIALNLSLNGHALTAIKNGSSTLNEGVDYTVSGTTVTIKKSYLATQAMGTNQ